MSVRARRSVSTRTAAASARRPAVLTLMRVDDWWLFHLLPLLAVAYGAALYFAVPANLALPALARLVVSIACIASYSHVVNDIGDWEADARVQKRSGHRPRHLPLLAGLLLAGGVVVWVGAALSLALYGLLGAIVVLQPAYALRPVRLKERGVWGVITDSLHTHALPTVFCTALFAHVAGTSAWRGFIVAAFAWSFLLGLRGILYHQRIDEANDRRAGLRTFVIEIGSDRVGVWVRKLLFPAEIIALAVVGATLFETARPVLVGFAVYGVVVQLLRLMRVVHFDLSDPAPAQKGGYLPLLRFYRTWPALAFALLLAAREPTYLVLLTVHLLVFHRAIGSGLLEVGRAIDVLRGTVLRSMHRSSRAAFGGWTGRSP